MIDIIHELQRGIKSGEYWYVMLAILYHYAIFTYLIYVERQTDDFSKITPRRECYAVKMTISSISCLILSIMHALMNEMLFKGCAAIVIISAFVLMFKLDIALHQMNKS